MEKNLLSYTNLYHALMTDEGGKDEAKKIIANVLKRLFIHYTWEPDCRQEIYTAWLGASYDLKRPRKEIMAYATQAAYIAVLTWRRQVIVTTSSDRRQNPEPIALSLDQLTGDDLDRFMDAIDGDAMNPEAININQETPSPHNPGDCLLQLSDVRFPDATSEKDQRKKLSTSLYQSIVERLAKGDEPADLAADLHVSRRTIKRLIERLAELNHIHHRRDINALQQPE